MVKSNLIERERNNHFMKYGYCRVSTKGQAKDGNSLEVQEIALRNEGAVEIYLDTFTLKFATILQSIMRNDAKISLC